MEKREIAGWDSEHQIESLPEGADANKLARLGRPVGFGQRAAAVERIEVRLRHDAAGEPQLRGFADAKRRLRGPSHFTRKPYLAEHRRRRRNWPVTDARR